MESPTLMLVFRIQVFSEQSYFFCHMDAVSYIATFKISRREAKGMSRKWQKRNQQRLPKLRT